MNSKIMKIALLIFTAVLFGQATASENYLDHFHTLLSKSNDPNLSKEEKQQLEDEFEDYKKSLTAEQAFQSAKYYWTFVEEQPIASSRNIREIYQDAPWTPALLFYEYTKKTEMDFEEIQKILREATDPNNNIFWRANMVDFLGNTEYLENLTAEQLNSIRETVNPIITGNQDRAIRFQAIQTVYKLINEINQRYILSDPLVQQKLDKGTSDREIIRAVEKGKTAVSEQYLRKRQKVLDYYDEYTRNLIPMISDPCTDYYLLKWATGYASTIAGNFEISSEQEIKSALQQALENYKKYDKKLWRTLVSLNIKCGNEQAEQTLQKMLDNTNVGYSTKDDLRRLKRKIENGKLKPRPDKKPSLKVAEIPASQQLSEPNAEDVNEVIEWLEQIWAEDKQLREELDPNQVRLLLETLKEQKQQLE